MSTKTTLSLLLVMILSLCYSQGNKQAIRSSISEGQSIENNTLSEPISEVVRMVFQDSKGNIWFGTQSGAFRLRGNSLMRIKGIQSEGGKRVTIKDITEGHDGKIWFGHTDGISSLEGETVMNYYESDGLISHDVWNMEADAQGNIWIGTIEGACTFDGQTFTHFELPEGIIDSTLGVSSTQMVHSILEDSQGAIWFCTNAGLFKYADHILYPMSEKLGIQTPFVNEVIEDIRGNFWISTKEALYKLAGDTLTNITQAIPEMGKGIGSIAEDQDGTIWFVFNQHHLYTYDGVQLKEFQKSATNEGPVIYQIFKDQSQRLWFVGYGGAYRLEDGRFRHISTHGPW
ncbi:MAG: two-component regulator propeller domain-containing protein [Bacteroidota bacterium]